MPRGRAMVIGASAPASSAVSRSKRKRQSASTPIAALLPSTAASRRQSGRSPAGTSTTTKKKRKSSAVESGTSSAGTSKTTSKRRKTSTGESGASGNVGSSPAKRRKVSPKAASEEKRAARYIARPSAATSERITRAFQHRMYLIDKKPVGDSRSPSACGFVVLGSTGNVYEVTLQQRPSCTCPDFPRSQLCKHILFVMLRVLKLSRNDPRVWQKALLPSEVKELLEISATSDGVLASDTVRKRFQEIQGSSGADEDLQSKSIQREVSGDCPICYEKMDDGNSKAKEPVIFCRVCGNNVHRDCFEKWSRSKSSSGGEPTCIYCRAPWSDESKPKGPASNYLNLAEFSDVHRTQDLSLESLYPDSQQWIRYHGSRRR